MVVAGLLRRSGQMLQRREETRLAFLPESEALAPYVQHMAVVQQPIQDGRRDYRVAEDQVLLSPQAVQDGIQPGAFEEAAFVRGCMGVCGMAQ